MTAPIVYSWPLADRDGIVTSTTLGAGVRIFTINGALAQGGSTVTLAGISREISVYSAGDLSALNFTVSGADYNGKLFSETISGPNNTTVYTTNKFWQIFQVSVDADMTAAAEIGSGTEGYTNWFSCNFFQEFPAFTVQAIVNAATVNYTLEVTLDDITAAAAGSDDSISVFTPSTDMTAATASKIYSTSNPYYYMRIRINSSNATGRLTATIMQQGPS